MPNTILDAQASNQQNLIKLVTLDEIAEALQYSKITIENWAYGRRSPPVNFPKPIKLAGRLRWRRQEIEAWLAGIPPAEPKQYGYGDPVNPPVRGRGRGRPRKIQPTDSLGSAA